jgi:hypothetical protein
MTLKHAFTGSSLPALILKVNGFFSAVHAVCLGFGSLFIIYFARHGQIIDARYAALPTNFSPDLRGLCGAMLMADPASRPSAADILYQPVLQAFAKEAVDGWLPPPPASQPTAAPPV